MRERWRETEREVMRERQTGREKERGKEGRGREGEREREGGKGRRPRSDGDDWAIGDGGCQSNIRLQCLHDHDDKFPHS